MDIRRGTSIIEIVIAGALISVSIIAALSLTNQSQKQHRYARDLAEATKYATQAADWIRTERNNLGWATIYAQPAGDYCLNDFPADFTLMTPGVCSPNSSIPLTNFRRQITLTKPGNTLRVKIVSSWNEKITRQAVIEMELASWY